MPRILIIEDEPDIVMSLEEDLRRQGYETGVANDGAQGLALGKESGWDLILLDVMLPKMDGWRVLKEIRANLPHQPVILLTALDDVTLRVKGLELGADDYLVKPFAFSELNARVRNILRRSPARHIDVLRVSDLDMDLLRHKVSRAGKSLDLAPQEYRLLEYLLQHAGEVLTRTRLAEQIWDINFDGDSNVIDAAVRRLRRKVDDPYDQKLIHTLRGVGYVLEEHD